MAAWFNMDIASNPAKQQYARLPSPLVATAPPAQAFSPLLTTGAPIVVQQQAQPKSAIQAQGVGDLYGQYNQAAPAKRQTLTEFTTQLLTQKPQVQAANASENQFIGTVYNDGPNSLSGVLDRIARQRAAATNAAAQSGARSALRTYNLGRMNGGNSSYLDRAYGQDLSRIGAQAASQLGTDQLNNQQMLLQARNGLLGRRQQLAQNYLDYSLYPYTAQNALIRDDASTLGQLGGLEAANGYGLDTLPQVSPLLRSGGSTGGQFYFPRRAM